MEGPRLYILTAAQVVVLGVMFWVLATWRAPWNAERYAGTALAIVGVAGVAIARYQLGKSFSIKPEAHTLVTTGIYARIRNPIYVFGAIMIAGLILVFQRPLWLIALFVLVIGQTLRARREARVLEAAFGDAYRQYRRKTWF
jgi:protein-S-isoprenylcysteine O-methyltransferase Ste14